VILMPDQRTGIRPKCKLTDMAATAHGYGFPGPRNDRYGAASNPGEPVSLAWGADRKDQAASFIDRGADLVRGEDWMT
jgi:hypothetical protein